MLLQLADATNTLTNPTPNG